MDAHARRRLSADVARLADGDRTAFDAVFAAAWPLLRGFCGRVLGDAHEAEDAAQQALLNVFARSTEYDPARDALPWLLAIAVNECRTLRQRRARRREDQLPETMSVQASAERAVLQADLEAAVRELVGDLPTPDEQDEPPMVRRTDGSWLMEGWAPVGDVEQELEVSLTDEDERPDFQTLAGFVLARLGRLPKPTEHVDWSGYRFEVVDMDGRRIDKVMVSRMGE